MTEWWLGFSEEEIEGYHESSGEAWSEEQGGDHTTYVQNLTNMCLLLLSRIFSLRGREGMAQMTIRKLRQCMRGKKEEEF